MGIAAANGSKGSCHFGATDRVLRNACHTSLGITVFEPEPYVGGNPRQINSGIAAGAQLAQ